MATCPSALGPDQDDWRPLTPEEAAVLDHLLSTDFPGRDGLRAQVRTTIVRRIDQMGSLRFRVEAPLAEVGRRVPVEGHYHDDGTGPGPWGPAVNLLLHVVERRLHELEIYKDDGSDILIGPFQVPLALIDVSTR